MPGSLSATTTPRRSTISTRPRTSLADVATIRSGAVSPAAVAATTSACPSDWVLTSASMRSPTERTSGTSIDPIASTST